MRKEILNSILAEYNQLRLTEELAAKKRYETALSNEAFALSDTALKKLYFELARAEAYGKATADIKKAINEETQRRNAALKQCKMTENDLLPRVHCKKCGDSGYGADGQLCRCVKQRLIEHLKKSCGMSGALKFHFSNNSDTVFVGTKQEKTMQGLYRTMKLFCDKFPKTKYLNVLLCGEAGVGKSYLISAVANEIMENGYSVMYLTAFEFNNLVLKYHTSPLSVRNEYLDDLMSAELLIIDDLGTEPILKNVSIDYLFSVVSSRMEHGLHTIFSTNLDVENLLERYGERVFSRLFHKKYTYAKRITGDDLRLKKN